MTEPQPPAPVELPASAYAALDAEQDQAEAAEYDDWDAFWSARTAAARRPARIRGVLVRPPSDMPLQLADLLMGGGLANATEDDLREAITQIFGAPVLDRWKAAGMGQTEYQVVLVWAGASMRGNPVSFAEAAEEWERANAEQAGAAGGKGKPAPAKRASGGRKKSGRAGR